MSSVADEVSAFETWGSDERPRGMILPYGVSFHEHAPRGCSCRQLTQRLLAADGSTV